MKPLFDYIIAIILTLFLLPIFIIIALLIKIDSPGEVFFRQERVGRYGKNFRIFKFRTMSSSNPAKDTKENNVQITATNDNRITKIGAILRKYKIDELPQIFNILLGQMSLVGPRPEVPKYVKLYSKQNLDLVIGMKPGITDLASIKYRNEGDILEKAADPEFAYINQILPKKLRYCRFYARKQSFLLDLKIIYLTVLACALR